MAPFVAIHTYQVTKSAMTNFAATQIHSPKPPALAIHKNACIVEKMKYTLLNIEHAYDQSDCCCCK